MKKRAELEFTTVIDLVLIAIVIGILFFFIADVSRNTYFQKSYLARDIALSIGAVQARPGTVYYNYSQENLKDYSVLMDKSIIKVYMDERELPGLYSYYSNSRSTIALASIKNKDVIFMAGCPTGLSVSSTSMKCPSSCPKATKGGQTSLAIAALPKMSIDISDAQMAKHAEQLAEYIRGSQSVFGQAQIMKDEDLSPDLVIVIQSVSSIEPYVKINYMLGSKESEAIACRIKEALIAKFPDMKVKSLPSKSQYFKGRAGIMIEIGSVMQDGILMPKDIARIAGAVNTGLRGFYAE